MSVLFIVTYIVGNYYSVSCQTFWKKKTTKRQVEIHAKKVFLSFIDFDDMFLR